MHINEKDKFKTIYISNYRNNKNNIHCSFAKWTKSKPLTASQLVLQLWNSRVQFHSQSLPCFYTIFWSLVPQNQLILSLEQKSLLCQISEVFQQIAPTLFHLSACHLIYTQPVRSYFKQTNLNLPSKHADLHLKSVTFSRRDFLLGKQSNIKLCSVIQSLTTIVQLSSS